MSLFSLKKSTVLLIFPRFFRAFKSIIPKIVSIFKFVFTSRETTTFTYRLDPKNKKYLIHLVSLITNKPIVLIESYFEEVENNWELRDFVVEKIKKSEYRYKKDLRCDFGSRMAWYAIIRANKSEVVVENGIEIGYTAVLLCAALLKNTQEGHKGKYFGLDINPDAGYLINQSPYNEVSNIIVADTMLTLSEFNSPIDFYFSDGVRTLDYERKEFDNLNKCLTRKSVVVTNKANFSDALADLAESKNYHFLYFQEQPQDYWYPGSGLGIMFNKII